MTTNVEKGKRFERHVRDCLKRTPLYNIVFSDVWLWGAWAKKQGIAQTDTGIDLVAQKKQTGELYAIQCKNYAEGTTLDKGGIDSFLSASGRSFNGAKFSECFLISTTTNISKHADETIKSFRIPCQLVDYYEISPETTRPKVGEQIQEYHLPEWPDKKKLRPDQEEAVANVLKGFQTADRGKLIMACGTGKTLVSLKIAERLLKAKGNSQGLILLLVPSLSLLSQTLREWSAQANSLVRIFAVCSDSKAGMDDKGDIEVEDEDNEVSELGIPPTTDSEKLAAELLKPVKPNGSQGMTVIFSTYQSIEVVAAAYQQTKKAFDLIICDEAHRTTGIDTAAKKTSPFVQVHNKDYIKAAKRLYMTATPRIYTEPAKQKAKEYDVEVFSMDDSATYGEELHRLDFSTAVDKNLLSDYKVLILGVLPKDYAGLETGLELNDTAKLIGCWNGLAKRIANLKEAGMEQDKEPMKRAVAFCSTIKASKQITEQFTNIIAEYRQEVVEKEEEERRLLDCEMEHVDGTDNVLERNKALMWLKEEPSDYECRVLSNVRCLSEGVDVPALDAVIFLSPRKSQVDIVQSVGRVMRKALGKKYGYIILPIPVLLDEDAEEALNRNDTYGVVWDVLQALRSHDNRFNAEINKIELNNEGGERIIFDVVGKLVDEIDDATRLREDLKEGIQLSLDMVEAWRDAILARVVLKCGDRRYWERWAKDVGVIAQRRAERIEAQVKKMKEKRDETFDNFLAGLQRNINPSIIQEDAIDMLSQHMITQPVFNALFEGYDFAERNPVSVAMQKMLERLGEKNIQAETEKLEGFYKSVAARASGIDNMEGKQKVINELYEQFFRTAFPRMAERLGIVYTPPEVVDFILHSANSLLQQEFGLSLSSENVCILDPFTGTGTFITRLLQSNLIKDEDLERKYAEELHANEIVLLAYYIAAINIEQAFHYRCQQRDSNYGYRQFEGIVFTDTFQLYKNRDRNVISPLFPINWDRAKKQEETPIEVIIGNPPYSAGQRSAHDNNPNLSYPKLDEEISTTYAASSSATLKYNLYDSYIRAIRWASDRLGKEGIVGFVTNGSYIDGTAMDGLRKCLLDEFTSVYCINLRGNARVFGEKQKQEGGGIFGQNSRATIAITFLVRNPAISTHKLYYYDIGDYLSRQEKLEKLHQLGSVKSVRWQSIKPNSQHDWIDQRSPQFAKFIPLGDKINKSRPASVHSIFNQYGLGVSTNRDSWVYNFSLSSLKENMARTIDFYNQQLKRYQRKKKEDSKLSPTQVLSMDKTKIKWDSTLQSYLARGKKGKVDFNHIRPGFYRPFMQKHLYFDRQFNSRVSLQPSFFPQPDSVNQVICVPGIGSGTNFSTLMVARVPNLHFHNTGRCFPRHIYNKEQDDLTGKDSRQDNISPLALESFRSHYKDKQIDGDAIFYYVYGLLHHPDYRTKFRADLRKMLPRIPFASSGEDFWAFSQTGKRLGELHIGYEDLTPYPLQIQGEGAGVDYKVKKMRFAGKAKETRHPDKTCIQYNEHIFIEGIPLEAYDYKVNGKSAIEWLMECYQIKIDKESGIKQDPNEWSDNPRYIIDLIGKIVHLSIETMKEVANLPDLDLDE